MTDVISDDNSNVCSISQRLQDIQKSRKVPKYWPWKWRSGSKSTRIQPAPCNWNVRLHIGDFFRIFLTRKNTFTQTCNTRTHKQQTHTYPHINPRTHTEHLIIWLKARHLMNCRFAQNISDLFSALISVEVNYWTQFWSIKLQNSRYISWFG